MTAMILPFFGQASNTIGFDVTGTSARVQVLPNASSTARWSAKIVNTGAASVFINAGDVTVTATIPVNGGARGSQCIAAGSTEVLTFTGPYLAAISASGTCTIYITEGYGI